MVFPLYDHNPLCTPRLPWVDAVEKVCVWSGMLSETT
jgi:hypothetical protein